MRAKTVNENINFQRGKSPRRVLDIGKERFDEFLIAEQWVSETVAGYAEHLSDFMGIPENQIYLMGSNVDFYDYDGLEILDNLLSKPSISETNIELKHDLGTIKLKLELFKTEHGLVLSSEDKESFENTLYYGELNTMRHLVAEKWLEL